MKNLISFFVCLLYFAQFAKCQQSFYMEYAMQIGETKEAMKTNNKIWQSPTGNRIESEINIPGLGVKKNVMLMLKSAPDIIYNLDNDKKSYTEVTFKGDEKEDEEFKIEIIGQEKMVGYSCTHAIISTQKQSFEIWTTKDIDGYKELYNVALLQSGAKGLDKAIKSKEIEGIMVLMKSGDSKQSFTMELTKFEKGNYPQSMFEIPAGYTKGMSFDPSKMQNMSPEERQKMLEELMKQYGKEEKE